VWNAVFPHAPFLSVTPHQAGKILKRLTSQSFTAGDYETAEKLDVITHDLYHGLWHDAYGAGLLSGWLTAVESQALQGLKQQQSPESLARVPFHRTRVPPLLLTYTRRKP
jgi:hypothetical protein